MSKLRGSSCLSRMRFHVYSSASSRATALSRPVHLLFRDINLPWPTHTHTQAETWVPSFFRRLPVLISTSKFIILLFLLNLWGNICSWKIIVDGRLMKYKYVHVNILCRIWKYIGNGWSATTLMCLKNSRNSSISKKWAHENYRPTRVRSQPAIQSFLYSPHAQKCLKISSVHDEGIQLLWQCHIL